MNKFIVTANEAGEIMASEPYVEQVAGQVASDGLGWIAWTIIGVVSLVVTLATLFIVKQQTVRIIERLGKFKNVAKAGLNIKIPFIDYVAGELSLRIQELKEDVGVKLSDNAFVTVPVKVQYKVIESEAINAFYVLDEGEEQISSYVVNIIRSTATKMTMDDVFKNKNAFELAVEKELKEKFSKFGFEIVNVLVDDPMPSKEVVSAFNKVIASKRVKEAAVNEAEALRVKMVGGAKAEAESLELKASAYVNQRKIMSEGLGEIGIDKTEVLPFLERIDWRDAIRDASSNKGSLIIVPADMNIGGDVAKIKALTN